MQKLGFQLLIILRILAMSCSTLAQQDDELPDQLFFNKLLIEDGLSQVSINAIIKDSRGFLWIGTEDGLNRYDGNEFRVYRNKPRDSTSITSNVIFSLLEEEGSGNIWVGTSKGLSYFNRLSEQFTAYQSEASATTCTALAYDYKRKRLWVAANAKGLGYVDEGSKSIQYFHHALLEEVTVWTIKVHNDKLYLGTLEHGLKVVDLINNQMVDYESKFPLLKHTTIRALLPDSSTLWIGTQTKGLFKLLIEEDSLQLVANESTSISSNKIWALAKQGEELWIGTDGGGLNIFDPEINQSKIFTRSDYDAKGINDNTIRCIYIEPDGHCWLGTFNGGVNYIYDSPLKFLLFKKEFNNSQTLTSNSVTCFAEDTDGTLWIGTGDGLSYLKSGKIYQYKFPSPIADTKTILSIVTDSLEALWIGTYDQGLIHIRKDGTFNKYLHDPKNKNSISSDIVWSVTEAHGKIWLATDKGINIFNRVTKTFHNYLSEPSNELFSNVKAQSILQSSSGILWFGTSQGLIRHDPLKNTTTDFSIISDSARSIHHPWIISLHEDAAKNIAIGTYGNGLCFYDPAKETFSIVDENDGLPNNVVLAIESDPKSGLWITTNKGLIKLSNNHKSFTHLDSYIGIQGTVFNPRASWHTKQGYLVFGGTAGFNMFKTVSTHKKHTGYLKVVLTDFKIFNQSVPPRNGVLSKSITETTLLSLPYDSSRLISFRFSALPFLSPHSISYQYKLIGFDDEWRPAGDDQEITFTNLSPGEYTLQLRASYDNQYWGNPTELLLRVRAPWWLTNYAKAAAVFLLLMLGTTFFYWRTYNLEQQRKKLELLVGEQRIEIRNQYSELEAQNEELIQQNEEMLAQKETISAQYLMLSDAQKNLSEINQSLELMVKQRTESLDVIIEKLNKTIKELDAFVYSASHDLVAPMKSVLGLVNLGRMKTSDAELLSYFDYMEKSVHKLEAVIQSMIQYSRNSRLGLQSNEINVGMLISECIEDLKFTSGFNLIQFIIDGEKDLTVLTDRIRLKMILNNLLSNAIKYFDPNKEKHMVHVSFKSETTSWHLVIEDNGIGIDKEYLHHVFEMFYRATERSQGSGLGLYIVKEAVDRMGGSIHVESELHIGTTFVLTLPLVDALSNR